MELYELQKIVKTLTSFSANRHGVFPKK